VLLSNPKTSLATGGTAATPITAASITGLAFTDYKNPTSYQYSVGMQRQLWENSVFSITYVGNQNRHQTDRRDVNLVDPSFLPGLINKNANLTYNQLVQYPGFHSIVLTENAENSHYNGLQMEFHGQVSKDLTLQAMYTLSRTIDPGASSFGGDLDHVSNPYDRAYDNGPAYSDRTHIGVINFIYQLPLFRNSQNQVLKSTLGGWELSGIVTMESGLPLNITLGGAASSNGLADGRNRPNISGSISYPQTVSQFFSTSAFSSPAIGAWGNLTKGAIRGPGRDNWNLSLFKSFVFSENRGSRFELRFESFNAFNHTQFKDVSATANFDSSGKTITNNFGQVTSTWDPRVFQLGAKLIF
jgi:hypothetical protein